MIEVSPEIKGIMEMEGAQVDQGEIIRPEELFSGGQLPGLLEDHIMSIGRSGGVPPEFLIGTNLKRREKRNQPGLGLFFLSVV